MLSKLTRCACPPSGTAPHPPDSASWRHQLQPRQAGGQGKAGSNAEQGAARWLGKWALQWRLKAAAGPWQGRFKVYSRAHPPALEMMLLWVSTAPLGTPVVPLV